MKSYNYKALNSAGQTVEGEFEVIDEKDVDLFFMKADLRPLRVAEKAGDIPLAKKIHDTIDDFFKRKLLENELIAFTRQFAAAYGAGLSVSNTLRMLAKQSPHERFKAALIKISERIEAGKGLTEAFALFPNFFSRTYLAILRSGEVSGKLDAVMNYSANLMEKKAMHRERIASTLLYPKIVVSLIVLTSFVIVAFVVPQFAKFYDRFGAQLPLPTLILIQASKFIEKFWYVLMAMVPLAGYGTHKLRQNPKFMLWFHQMFLRLPIFGICFNKIELTHFCATFALLLRSGIRITEATRIALDSMQNTFLRQELAILIPRLEQGGTLAQALNEMTVIPPLMISMVAIGEESGELDQLLDRVALLYENETDALLKKLPTLLEPVILGILFVMVLFLAIAVYLPIWRMASLLKK